MTNEWNDVRKPSRTLLGALALAALIGCHDSHHGGKSVGSESHFLAPCTSDASCGGLRCIAGMCTKSCTGDRECSALGRDGECLASNAGTRTAASDPICSIACTQDATCAALGDGLRCASGRCSAESARAGSGAAGTGAVRAGTAGSTGSPGLDPLTGTLMPPSDSRTAGTPRACALDTPFPGDDACIPPPKQGEGIQIHFGPSRYDDPAELEPWLLNPGDEVVDCKTYQMPEGGFPFAEWELSARPGQHHSVHVLNKSEDRYDICFSSNRPSTVPDLLVSSSPRPRRVAVAPENAAIARNIPDHAPAIAWVHSFNFTDGPLLSELWLNLYVPRETPVVYDVPFHLGQDGEIVSDPNAGDVARFSCPIAATEDGRLLSLTALTLPSTRSFEARLRREDGDALELLRAGGVTAEDFEGPTTLRYDSVTVNPMPSPMQAGGFSGQVELLPGDVLEWECRIDRSTASPGHMCELAGSATVELGCE
jgi:hypothetical protein